MQQFGACIAYTVVIADLLQPILSISGAGFFDDRWPLQVREREPSACERDFFYPKFVLCFDSVLVKRTPLAGS